MAQQNYPVTVSEIVEELRKDYPAASEEDLAGYALIGLFLFDHYIEFLSAFSDIQN